ncbi:ral guanine nucleotide dissociation stimulator-like 3 isoform X2 [Ahaetulla prasina]|uniref:ral guanine nucleotide dissociation stimulator-like 3 isoform X2 n=1 Tax=Ahaetulla prasina TaxID=499056 RepID=UPI0026481E54|nr:ral guanine nucleotide dissociation stimulator-like 3 isoform X2 [Ahaetulla prasina]
MDKAEMAMMPLQPWGEETEDGAIYSITLERVKAEPAASGASSLKELPETSECPFVQYRTCKRRTLRAATLPQLVKWLLTANKEGDLDYTSSFLATYQAFTTLMQVLELLLPLGPDKAVLHILEQWLQHHPEDFWEPPEYPNLHKILCFLHQSAPNSPVCALAKGLLQTHKEKEADGGNSPGMRPSQVITEAVGTDDCEEIPALMSFSVNEVAEQLTLMDAHLFRAVLPFHCLGCIWSQRDKKENQHMAPSVRATVTQFNAVTSCVITSVLGDLAMRIPQRAHLLEKWIQIARQCRALRNFSSLYAILSALQSNSIYRLKRTWAAVNRDIRNSFRKLSQIFSEDHNHLNCREILLQEGDTQGPCDGWRNRQTPVRTSLKIPTIPYLGIFLTDLIMLDTALPDFVEGQLINFEKRRKEAAVLFCICHLQQSCQGYNLCLNPSFHLAFHHQRQLSEDQSYYISCMIEPPTDSCPNSPKLHRSLTKRFNSLLLSSETSATPSGSEKTGTMPLGSYSSLSSEDGSSVPCSPTWVSPDIKDPPITQWKTCPLREQPVPPSMSKQGETETRIVRVHMNSICGNGNLYRSILITSQDKTTAVIQRALQKHKLEEDSPCNYQLLQLLGDGQEKWLSNLFLKTSNVGASTNSRELLIPDSANVFYAMNPAGPHDFFLLQKKGITSKSHLRIKPGNQAALCHIPSLKDFDASALASSCFIFSHSAPNSPVSLSPSPSAEDPHFRSCLSTHPFPAPSSWFLENQSAIDTPDSPPPCLSLPQNPFPLETRSPVPPHDVQKLLAPPSVPQSPSYASKRISFWSKSPPTSPIEIQSNQELNSIGTDLQSQR